MNVHAARLLACLLGQLRTPRQIKRASVALVGIFLSAQVSQPASEPVGQPLSSQPIRRISKNGREGNCAQTDRLQPFFFSSSAYPASALHERPTRRPKKLTPNVKSLHCSQRWAAACAYPAFFSAHFSGSSSRAARIDRDNKREPVKHVRYRLTLSQASKERLVSVAQCSAAAGEHRILVPYLRRFDR